MRSGWATGSGAATSPRRSSSAAVARRPGWAAWIATRGKLGAYLSLKLRLPATRVAPLAVGSAPAPFLSRRAKSLSRHGCQRHPGLKITGRGFEREKRRGGEGREPIGLEIVELDEGDAGAVRPHDDVALLGGCEIEHPRQLALELRERHVAAEQFLDRRRTSSMSHRNAWRRRWRRDRASAARHAVLCCLPPLQPPVFIVTL